MTITEHDWTPEQEAKLTELLTNWDACRDARKWLLAGCFQSPSAAWRACESAEWMLFALDELGLREQKKDVSFAVRCMRETPLHDGRTPWDLLTAPESRAAVEVAERWLAGRADQEGCRQIADAALRTADALLVWPAEAARKTALAAWKTALAALVWPAEAAVQTAEVEWLIARAAGLIAGAGMQPAGANAAWQTAYAAAQKAQAGFLRAIYGDPLEGLLLWWRP